MSEEMQKYEAKVPEKKPEGTKAINKVETEDMIIAMIPTAGTIELTDKQREILYAEVKEEDVEIRPDGLIYLPWMEYVSRLRDAFGIGWAIIPQGMPSIKGNFVMWGFHLVIDGKLAGFAIGEQNYYPTNSTMTYGDAIEGAKSNALMRLCKGIGISLELWKPSFVRAWKEKYAEQYPATWPDGKPKIVKGVQALYWRKKGTTGNVDVVDVLDDYAQEAEATFKTPDESSDAELQRMIYEIAQRQDKTPESILEGFTCQMRKGSDGKWEKVGAGVESLGQYRGDKNKLFERVKKYWEKGGK